MNVPSTIRWISGKHANGTGIYKSPQHQQSQLCQRLPNDAIVSELKKHGPRGSLIPVASYHFLRLVHLHAHKCAFEPWPHLRFVFLGICKLDIFKHRILFADFVVPELDASISTNACRHTSDPRDEVGSGSLYFYVLLVFTNI